MNRPDNSGCSDSPPQSVTIDRCVCTEVTFAAMAEWVRTQRDADTTCSPDFDDVRSKFRCGTMCGLCRPYVRRMIETGETSFKVVLEQPTSMREGQS